MFPEGVKAKMKMMIMAAVHQSWHFMAGPTRSRPRQLITKQPIITPIIPYRAVDAPARTSFEGLQARLKIFPHIPETRQMTRVWRTPKVYSILDKNMKMVTWFPKICMKQTCRKMAETRRQTCPLRTPGRQLPPYLMRVSAPTSRKQSLGMAMPTDSSKTNMPILTRVIRVVRERNLYVGQRAKISMSKQLSSFGFFICLLPEMNRIRCCWAIANCSATGGWEIPPKSGCSLSRSFRLRRSRRP